MIAPLRTSSADQRTEFVQNQFLTMLPMVRRQAWIAFRGLGAEAREELIQEVIANAYCAFAQLVRRGKQAVAYPTPLAQFAIRQIRSGRRVGSQLNRKDLLSPYARRLQGFTIEQIDRQDKLTGAWSQILVEDQHAGPAETAAARIDVAEWLGTLPWRQRRIAKALALGEPTCEAARKFGLCPARISQLRRWFRRHWEQFQGGDSTGRQCSLRKAW
jgi:hypothetical protein